VHWERQFLIGALAPEVKGFNYLSGSNRLRKKSEKQIPRGLKPARDDKKQAHLKVRPFKTLAETGFFSSLSSRFPERSPNAALKRCSTLYTKSETSLARPTVVPSGPRLWF
jgi:hypothetical protein